MLKVPLFDLNYDEKEKAAVNSVLDGKWLSMGQKTAEFEDAFSRYLGRGVFSAAVSSGTAALHLSLLASGITTGDEVITSGLTFIACPNVIRLTGATPVLADSKSFSDWNVCWRDIESRITPRTKAIMVVHYAGYPCDMDEIAEIARKHKLVLIEDAAHAVGADYKGRKCGTLGDVGCFSFFSNKNLSTGEGGMVVTRDRGLYEKFKLLRSHGMTSMTIDRHNNKAISYDVALPGLNYRIDEIRAALGIEQLKKLDDGNSKRKMLAELYRKELSGVEGITLPWPEHIADRQPSYHIFPVMLPTGRDRKAVMEYMRDKGIQTSIHYPAFMEFSGYREIIKENLKTAVQISSRVLTLPMYPGMAQEEVGIVCKALKECLDS